MRRSRWLAGWKDSVTKPVIYHCISRVVARTMAAYIYFGDGAVIGSKEFVNEAFARARQRFSAKRKEGARAMRGRGSGAEGLLWSARALRVRV